MGRLVAVERKLKTQVLGIAVGTQHLIVTSIARGKNTGVAVLDPATLDEIDPGVAKALPPAKISAKIAAKGQLLCANAKLACVLSKGVARLYDIKTQAVVADVPGGPFDDGQLSKRYLWLCGQFGNGLFGFSLRGKPTKFPDPLNAATTTVTAFAIDRSERWCAIGNSSGYVMCFEIKTGEERFGGRPTRGGHITALAFSSDAGVLYSGSASGMLVRIKLA